MTRRGCRCCPFTSVVLLLHRPDWRDWPAPLAQKHKSTKAWEGETVLLAGKSLLPKKGGLAQQATLNASRPTPHSFQAALALALGESA